MQKRSLLLLKTQLIAFLTLILFAFNSSLRGSEHVKFITYHFIFVFPRFVTNQFLRISSMEFRVFTANNDHKHRVFPELTNQVNNQSLIQLALWLWRWLPHRNCRNISHCQWQQSYSALRSSGRSCFTYVRVCFKFWDVISQNNWIFNSEIFKLKYLNIWIKKLLKKQSTWMVDGFV